MTDDMAFFTDNTGNVKYSAYCLACKRDCKQSHRAEVVECIRREATRNTIKKLERQDPARRELTAKEKQAIRELVRQCANYDKEDKSCLPLETGCYMMNKHFNGGFCRWFQQAVLPLNPALEAALLRTGENMKACAVCGGLFPVAGRKAYCSEKCREIGKKAADAKRAKKYRLKKG